MTSKASICLRHNSSTQFHDDDEPQAYRERYRGVIVGSHPHFAGDVIMNNSPRPVVPVRASVRIKIKAVDAFSLPVTSEPVCQISPVVNFVGSSSLAR